MALEPLVIHYYYYYLSFSRIRKAFITCDSYLIPSVNYICYCDKYISIMLDSSMYTCVFFISKGNPFLLLFYSTVAGVVPCGGRKKSPRTSPKFSL